jgi:mono/diheme cytochrome c family protein
MRIHGIALLGMALGMMAAPLASASEPETGRLIELGRQRYLQYCASCHGLKAKGDGLLAEVLKNAPADLTLLAAKNGGVFPEQAVHRFIDGRNVAPSHGAREMPVWGEQLGLEVPGGQSTARDAYAKSRIQLILTYLKAIQGEGARAERR